MSRVPWLTKKSLALLGVAALLGLGLMVPSSTSGPGELPVLSEIDRDDVQRIEISLGQLDKMVITGSMDAGWTIVAPFEAEADDLMVRSLLKVFQDPVRMDVKVDEGEEALETYLVDDQNGALVELFGAGEAPLVSVVIGGDMPGGHSFVRLPGSQVVYRARVGSRGRVDRDFSEWRDKMVVQDNPEEVRWIALTRGEETLRFLRAELGPPGPDGTPNLGPWVYLEDPEFPVDQEKLNDIVSAMAVLRAGRILSADFEGGFAQPAVVVGFGLTEEHVHTLTFGGRTTEQGAFLKADDKPETWLVGKARLERALQGLEDLRALRVLSFQREQVASVRLEDSAGVPTTLAPADDGVLWEVTEPANVDADVQQIFFAINTLATLKADGVAPLSAADAGLAEPAQRITVRLKDGSTQVLEVGKSTADAQGRVVYFVRRAGTEEIYVLRGETLARVRQAFNRAD
ncbi:MAG: DUF4340 domain-containing protein [Alphaproteobacteria bacterium]|nr:DUF4340 domain-containing protein [Alphaproteobacteria bacterium]MCB9794508.1 DUF4340 domain-containing protein [Alphaproteobacteria bacterium]